VRGTPSPQARSTASRQPLDTENARSLHLRQGGPDPPEAQPRKPRSSVANLPTFGSTEARSPGATPNQRASVAAYWSVEVVGIHRPWAVKSSGPPSASVGNVPYVCRPSTAPPSTSWWLPQAWSEPPPEAGASVRPKSERVKDVTWDATPSCTIAA